MLPVEHRKALRFITGRLTRFSEQMSCRIFGQRYFNSQHVEERHGVTAFRLCRQVETRHTGFAPASLAAPAQVTTPLLRA
jgi:hypothetical protein